MFGYKGNVLKEVKIESCGRTEDDFFCWYRYKEECEPEANKIKYPNSADRWYEDYIYISIITEAKRNGAIVTSILSDDRVIWNEEFQKFILRKEVFNDEKDYYEQLR